MGTRWSGRTNPSWQGADMSATQKMLAHLSNDLAGLRVPTQCSIVFAARQEQIGILLAPRHGQDSLLMATKDLQRQRG